MLVRHFHTSIKPGGGPAGYLHYLRRAVAENTDTGGVRFDFVEAARSAGRGPSVWRRGLGRLQRALPHIPLSDFEAHYRATIGVLESNSDWLQRSDAERLFASDLLVVHEAFVAERLVKLCPRLARQKLVLVTHAPTFLAHERASMVCPEGDERDLYCHPAVQKVVQREMDVMQHVRVVAWPCEEAQEGYAQWREFAARHSIPSVYVETGVPRPMPRNMPEDVRRQWGVEEGQKIALFLGRPHPHKGFDRFLDWADECRRQGRSDWVFVQAGGAFSGARDVTAVRHVGYVEDNAAAYLASDLALIPNRYAYLDIGALETLALGAKAAMTPVGGHKHLLRSCPAIPAIPDGTPAEVWAALERIAETYCGNAEQQEAMQRVWAERYSLSVFAANHIHLARQLSR